MGSTVSFNCAVDKPGMSPVQYTWSVNNTVLANETGMTFTIVNLTMEGGTYTCNASNNISNVASNRIELQPYRKCNVMYYYVAENGSEAIRWLYGVSIQKSKALQSSLPQFEPELEKM